MIGRLLRWLLKVLAIVWASPNTLLGFLLGMASLATGGHEWVHVGQYERWGPLFIPAYLLSSLGLWLIGRYPYRDNPFERAAYRRDK